MTTEHLDKPYVSILMPTYKRGPLICYALAALTKQTYKNFEILVVLKPSNDGTEDVVKKYEKLLIMKLIIQNRGNIADALNLGLTNASGAIIAFLDDDAIPPPDWVKTHVETYVAPNIGGVAGNVVPVSLSGETTVLLDGKSSEIIPEEKPFLADLGLTLWNCPLKGLEDHLVYISRAGIVSYNFKTANRAKCQITKSLLGMGANMSILSKAVEGFRLPDSMILGLSNEQLLGWHLWRKGYHLFFNPKIVVDHIHHGQTLSRNITDKRKETLRWVENNLLFYRLYGLEPELSIKYRIIWIIFNLVQNIKKICADGDISQLTQLKSLFYSELIGLKWLLHKKLGLEYSPLTDKRRLGFSN